MKAKMKNQEFVEGRLYQHNLVVKQVQNKESANYGKDFISGTIDIATDEEGLNVVSVHYTYITEFTKSGGTNSTFTNLNNIINGARTWLTDGKDVALKVRCSTSLGLNDFYTQDGKLVSAKRNEGGFISTVKDLNEDEEKRSEFLCDMVITSVARNDTEDGADDFVRIKGAVFDYRNALLPVEFVCRDQGGMSYFESLDASPSNPIFTEVRGKIVSNTVKKEIEEESAFGSASVRTVTNTVKEWQVTWARPVEYDFGEEDTITAADLQKAMQDREVYLATIKKNHDDYVASKAVTKPADKAENAMNVPDGGFNF